MTDLFHLAVFVVSAIVVSFLAAEGIWRISQKISRRACEHQGFYQSCVDCRIVSKKADSVTTIVTVIVVIVSFILTKHLLML